MPRSNELPTPEALRRLAQEGVIDAGALERALGLMGVALSIPLLLAAVPLAVVGWVRHRPEGGIAAAIDRCAYWRNPLEVHAYGRAHRIRAMRASAAAPR